MMSLFNSFQRTLSSGSLGSLDSNSVSLAPANSSSLFDTVLESERSSGSQGTGASPFPLLPQSSGFASAPGQDFFSPSFVQPSETSSARTGDLFANMTDQNATTYLEQKPSSVPFPENEGWATFDVPNQATSAPQTKQEAPTIVSPENSLAVGNLETLSSVSNYMQWTSVQSSTAFGPFSLTHQQYGKTHEMNVPNGPTISQVSNLSI